MTGASAERPFVQLGPDVCGDLESGIRDEWLVTNGLGGYAFGTVAGPPTRVYHGLLVAALAPPVGRTVLVGGLLEWAVVDGERVALHALEHADGRIDGDGYRRLVSARLDGMRPVFTYAIGGVRIEKRIWMAEAANTTYVRYDSVGADRPIELELTPLTTFRDHHETRREADGIPGGPLRILAPDGSFAPHGSEAQGRWIRDIRHREETARGLPDRSDLWAPGTARFAMSAGHPATLIFTAEPTDPQDPALALAAAVARETDLLELAGARGASDFVRDLVLAADQFLVRRDIPIGGDRTEPGRTVIAGYPWFNDWGRDTMISLPGLCLSTGRHAEAAAILRSFARFVRDGLLPNNFPDHAGEVPEYHTIDASVWYPLAVRAHAVATGSGALIDELLPTLRSLLDAHVAGTRFGIGMDPADGLLRGGAEGYQLTWMDARVDGWVVTPRRGKPVEIQALWISSLRAVGGWLVERGNPDGAGTRYLDLADRAVAAFVQRFWRPELGYLADVVDGPDGDDLSLRPNQVFALSVPYPLVQGEVAASVVDAVGRALAVPLGLRSLAPGDPAYRPVFQGDRRFRDAAYHQGTVWTWLIGPYAAAVARVRGDAAAGLDILRPFEAHLRTAGLGSVSEILEPEPPFEPRGCPFQAWGVAEVLRVWRALGGN
ncbi:MAG: glycogen debranching enzyme family protein [Chloroflexi bacterium]|nr:glycogen debranching enzyme family protein [Chloroflexota bacterium]